jgi:hypothetical protein
MSGHNKFFKLTYLFIHVNIGHLHGNGVNVLLYKI